MPLATGRLANPNVLPGVLITAMLAAVPVWIAARVICGSRAALPDDRSPAEMDLFAGLCWGCNKVTTAPRGSPPWGDDQAVLSQHDQTTEARIGLTSARAWSYLLAESSAWLRPVGPEPTSAESPAAV